MWLILQSPSTAILHRTDFFAPYVCSDEASALANNSDTWNQWERIIHMLQTSKSDKWHLLWPTYIPPHSKYPNSKIEVVAAASLTTTYHNCSLGFVMGQFNCLSGAHNLVLLLEFLKFFFAWVWVFKFFWPKFEYFPWILSFLEYVFFQKGPISKTWVAYTSFGYVIFQ